MTSRVCSTAGCGTLIPAGTRGYKCTRCARGADKARGTRQERGYDAAHDQLRAKWQRRLDDGLVVHCWRCGDQVDPTNWTLGHCDIDRTKYHGPECPRCDYATMGRTDCPHPSHSS